MKYHCCIRGRNCAVYLDKALKSVVRQKVDWRAYVSLDAPDTDEPAKIAAAWVQEHSDRMWLNINSKHQGVAGNMYKIVNYALGQADDDDVIVVGPDADDRLTSDALVAVDRVYRENPRCLVTYGSYEKHSVGRKTRISQPYPPDANVRTHPWRGSHLKTFKAKLGRHLKPEMFQWDGVWLSAASDLALMFPLLEMAGLNRCVHIAKPIYVWRDNSSSPMSRKLQRKCEKLLRKRKPYRRIDI